MSPGVVAGPVRRYTVVPVCLQVLLLALCAVVVTQAALYGARGPRFALLHVLHLAHALSMHWVTWLAQIAVPPRLHSLAWLAPLWLAILWLSRALPLHRLTGLDIFTAMLRCRL